MSNSIFRNSAIDFLRGIAIFSVLIHHFHISYHLNQSALTTILSANFIKTVCDKGNYGVTMFFVISGFLITSTSLTRYTQLSKIDILGFYSLRLARIMPCMLLLIGIIVLFNFAHLKIFMNKPNTTSLFIAILSIVTFWHNVLMAKVGYFNDGLNIFWSLSVEEVFYFTFPILCLTFKKARFIIPIWIFFIIIAPIYRSHYADNDIISVYGYLSCFDAIAIGCCTAVLAQKIQLNEKSISILKYGAILLIAFVYLFVGIMENIAFCFSYIALGTAILLICASQQKSTPQHSTNIFKNLICWFGKNSYELYLFHLIVLLFIKQIIKPDLIGDNSKVLWLIIFLVISAAIAGFISKYFSIPMNNRIREFMGHQFSHRLQVQN